jgi:hypothetical protein
MIVRTQSRKTYCGCDFFPTMLNQEVFSTPSLEEDHVTLVQDFPGVSVFPLWLIKMVVSEKLYHIFSHRDPVRKPRRSPQGVNDVLDEFALVA